MATVSARQNSNASSATSLPVPRHLMIALEQRGLDAGNHEQPVSISATVVSTLQQAYPSGLRSWPTAANPSAVFKRYENMLLSTIKLHIIEEAAA
ncbi:hypothetical protein FRC11_000932 [Ceratobasidium sp. 423]|nr:hypothetical protein FRC11_000932 [Ceratobasidium sp. 423]